MFIIVHDMTILYALFSFRTPNDRWLCISSTVYVFSIDGDFYLFQLIFITTEFKVLNIYKYINVALSTLNNLKR